MTEQGVVLSVKNEFAKVRVGRNSACASCGKCGMTERQKYVDFYADNAVGAKEGETVVLDIPDTNSAKFAFVGYFVPLAPALGLLFLALGLKWEEWIAALLFMGGLAIGFAVVALIDKFRKHKWMETPQIVQVVHQQNSVASGAQTHQDAAEENQSENKIEQGDNKDE